MNDLYEIGDLDKAHQQNSVDSIQANSFEIPSPIIAHSSENNQEGGHSQDVTITNYITKIPSYLK